MKIEVVNIRQSEEQVELGKNLVQEGEFEKAELMLKKAIKLNAEAHFWLGVAFFNKEKYRRAIFVLTKCIALAPDNYKAYGLRGYNHYELFELDRAISDYTKAIELNPDDVISYNNRGLAHEKNGEYELALEDYTKAIELEPNEVSGYYNLGNIYLKLAEYEKALAEYDRALEMSDDEWLTSCIRMNRETAEKLLLKGERKVWGRTPVNIRFR